MSGRASIVMVDEGAILLLDGYEIVESRILYFGSGWLILHSTEYALID